MALFDLPLEALREYRSSVDEPADFEAFWEKTIAETRAAAWAPRVEPVDAGLALVDISDVTFSGFGGDEIRAWWTVPADREPTAVIVEFIGYGGGRGLAHDVSNLVLAGYAHLTIDSRGQGGGHWRSGHTGDPHGSGSMVGGVMTKGIEDPSTYYYRRFYADTLRALETARELAPGLPLIITGVSQGGGLTIAAAGLAAMNGIEVAGAMPDVPFLCDFPRATTITDNYPYREIAAYLAGHRGREGQVYATLAYFDGVNFARRATAPTLFSAALMDGTCPPSTVFGAFNAWGSADKRIEVYPFNDHEGGGSYQRAAQLAWVAERLA